jgi:hypothetical protein
MPPVIPASPAQQSIPNNASFKKLLLETFSLEGCKARATANALIRLDESNVVSDLFRMIAKVRGFFGHFLPPDLCLNTRK